MVTKQVLSLYLQYCVDPSDPLSSLRLLLRQKALGLTHLDDILQRKREKLKNSEIWDKGLAAEKI